MPEFTDLPQNKPQEPVLNKETQPLARFYEFWKKEVLGKDTKKAKEFVQATKPEQQNLLASSYQERVRQLITELKIPAITADVATIETGSLENYYQALKKNTQFNQSELSGLESWIQNIKSQENQFGVENPETKATKQRFYLWLTGRYVSKLQSSAFGFLPKVAFQHQAIDCSLAAALGIEIAKMAQFADVELLQMIGHSAFAVKAENGELLGLDYKNSGKIWVLEPGEDILTESRIYQTYQLKNPEEYQDLVWRLFIRKKPNEAVQSVISNTHYALGKNGFKELLSSVKNKEVKKDDENRQQKLQSNYGRNLLSQMQDLFCEPEHLTLFKTPQWQAEEARIAN